ncbi:MAG TPA: MG2 domain-containing protein [Anaerolineaceae bacterium]|nr:MG2 domain-containing protein [Anaerolineaceae bacterium]
MQKTGLHTICILILLLLTACSAPVGRTASPVPGTATPEATSAPLQVQLLYPSADSAVVMGQGIKLVTQVADEQGRPVDDAEVTVDLADPDGQPVATLSTQAAGEKGVYRTENWPVPHRSQAGEWTVTVSAARGEASGSAGGAFRVENSTSEELFSQYGFWLEAPTLRGNLPSLAAERGDAQNGMIRWGGAILNQHVMPQKWIDVNWRAGEFPLETAEDVEAFLLGGIDDLAFAQVREIGPYERVRFKQWDAWKVGGVGGVARDLLEWVVFYAPEVDKTYSLGTTVTTPPPGVDVHAELRASFDVDLANTASGVAPDPLPERLPAPNLVAPPLAAKFVGPGEPVVLEWEPVKELAEDEYYQVFVEFNYVEASPDRYFFTRETQFTLPEELYRTPNCFVFNWQITLMRQTGVDADGQPVGEEISNPSLYRYFWWRYPADQPQPFPQGCPNDQF